MSRRKPRPPKPVREIPLAGTLALQPWAPTLVLVARGVSNFDRRPESGSLSWGMLWAPSGETIAQSLADELLVAERLILSVVLVPDAGEHVTPLAGALSLKGPKAPVALKLQPARSEVYFGLDHRRRREAEELVEA